MTVAVAAGLPKAHVPVLPLYGAKDELVKVQASIARLKEFNPRVQARLYDNSGHASFFEGAQRFNRDMMAFVTQASAAASIAQ